MKPLFLFSGLGADHRVFQFLNLDGFRVNYIEWLHPAKKETMQQYAERLAEQIDAENPVLVGLSFGGMMAVEVAKHISTEKLILISSAKTRNEIPPYFRLAGKLKLNKFNISALTKKPNKLAFRMMGAETQQEKQLMRNILSDTDPVFFKWAIEKVVTWKNETIHKNITHIHGDNDLLLPYRYVKADITIRGGTHLMTVQNAAEISQWIKKIAG